MHNQQTDYSDLTELELEQNIIVVESNIDSFNRGNPNGYTCDDIDEMEDDLYDLKEALEDLLL